MHYNGNNIVVAQVRSLEVGDTFAHTFLGDVISGTVTGIAHIKIDLTDDQLAYVKNQGITLPEGIYEPIGGPSQSLVFGKFVYSGDLIGRTVDHMFLDHNTNVAVFPKRPEREHF